jgi:nitroreductase
MYSDKAEAVLECIRERKSIRKYADRPVPDNLIQSIIHAGIEAPTAMGLQPWRFVVIRDKGLMKRISDFCKGALLESLERYPPEHAEPFRKVLRDPGYSIFFNAPLLIFVLGDDRCPQSGYDCTLCAGNMLLAASSLGLGGCWMGSAEVVAESPELLGQLRVPEHFRIVAPLIFGYPAVTQPKKPERREPFMVWID